MKCHNCERNAMYVIGPEKAKFPVCLDCYIRWRNINQQEMEQLERDLNYAVAEFESISGSSGIVPRYPPRARPQVFLPGALHLNNINVNNSEIGVLNSGTIGQVDATVTVIREHGNEALAKALARLSEAVIKSGELSSSRKSEVLELLEALSAEAVAPKDKQRPAVMQTLAGQVTTTLAGVTSLAELWTATKALFDQLIGP